MSDLISREALLEAYKKLLTDYYRVPQEKIHHLITNAPQQQWVGLTSEQITNIGMQHQSLHQIAKAIDNELRKLNNV